MEFVLGLTSAFSWGTAYFMVRFATRTIGTARTTFYTYLIGVLVFTAFVLLSGEWQKLHSDPVVWGWLVLAAALNLIGAIADFRAIQVGYLSIATPITANYAGVTTAWALLAGTMLDGRQLTGIGLALVALLLITFRRRGGIDDEGAVLRGVAWALLAALGFGTAYYIIGAYVVGSLGGLLPGWATRVLTVLVLVALARFYRGALILQPPTGRTWLFVAAFGIGDSLATLASFVGYTLGNVAIVTTLASLYTAVTVILAWWLLDERLQRQQWAGVLLAILGIALMSV